MASCFGGLLARRNDRRSRSDALLVESLNDAVSAIAAAASGVPDAQTRYASATSRVVPPRPPEVVAAFRHFQDDANTFTADGRGRLIAAILEARRHLGHVPVSSADAHVLLFGPGSSGARRLMPLDPLDEALTAAQALHQVLKDERILEPRGLKVVPKVSARAPQAPAPAPPDQAPGLPPVSRCCAARCCDGLVRPGPRTSSAGQPEQLRPPG